MRLYYQCTANVTQWKRERIKGATALHILATFKGQIKSGTDMRQSHLWWLYSTAPMGGQAISTITQFPIQLYYPDTALTMTLAPWPDILVSHIILTLSQSVLSLS